MADKREATCIARAGRCIFTEKRCDLLRARADDVLRRDDPHPGPVRPGGNPCGDGRPGFRRGSKWAHGAGSYAALNGLLRPQRALTRRALRALSPGCDLPTVGGWF